MAKTKETWTPSEEGWVTDPAAIRMVWKLKVLKRGDLLKWKGYDIPMTVYDPANYYRGLGDNIGNIEGWKPVQHS